MPYRCSLQRMFTIRPCVVLLNHAQVQRKSEKEEKDEQKRQQDMLGGPDAESNYCIVTA